MLLKNSVTWPKKRSLDFRHLCNEEVASVVTILGTVLMGEGSNVVWFIASLDRRGQISNILGENRIKTVSVFLVLTGKGNWVSVAELTCHLCGQWPW